MEHFSMREQFVLVAGSASPACKIEQLRKAHEFVRSFTRHVLQAGAGVVVFASSEPPHPHDQELPLVFDWTVLGEVDNYLKANGGARQCVRIVTSNKAMTTKWQVAQRALVGRLSAQQAVEIAYVADDLHTGGNIGDKQVELAQAMIVVSGGKGVADRAAKLGRKGAPIIALDIDLGSIANDGPGGVGLYRKCLLAPREFLPITGSRLPSIIPSISLRADNEPSEVARIVTDLLVVELDAQNAARPIEVLVLTALALELSAAREALGLQEAASARQTSAGTLYWVVDVPSTSSGRNLRVALSCFGGAGNIDAAATTTELLTSLKPRFVVMLGIAAGIRGKCRMGEVLIADRLVAYEPSAVIENGEARATQEHRPDIYRIDHATEQCVAAYVSSGLALAGRITELRAALGGDPPKGCDEREVAVKMAVRFATFASGEKLLRSAKAVLDLRKIHGKVEVVEMEGVGVFAACRHAGQPCLVIRGISDHGDNTKDDRFHDLAAKGAAVVAADFLRNGLRLAAATSPCM